MLKILYTQNELLVNGNKSDLKQLISGLESSKEREIIEIENKKEIKIESYEGSIKKFIIQKNNDKVLISREGENAKISGKQELLKILANNIAFLWTNNSPHRSNHLHVEWYEEHFYLHPNSLSIIFELEEKS